VIILAGTPIGNLGDATTRLRDALQSAKYIAAEDTRVTKHLCIALGIETAAKLISLNDFNEASRVEQLLEIASEDDLLVLSDAGMPTISDPGFKLVRAAVDAGIEVTALPGPSAPIMALAISGLPSDRFTFEGFMPRKAGERARLLRELANLPHTLIFFESPNRLVAALESVAAELPDREVAVARELTKKFEEVRRGKATDLLDWAERGVKGEIVLLIAGVAKGSEADSAQSEAKLDTAVSAVFQKIAEGASTKDAVAEESKTKGIQKRELYEAVLKAKNTTE